MTRDVLKVTAVIVFAVVVWLAVASALWGFSVATAGIYGRGEAHKQIQSAEFRITAYNHFFDLCVAVQTDEGSLDAQFDLLAQTTDAETTRIVNVNIAALKANRLRSINQYNADAAKDYTIGQFRDANLPYQLPAVSYDKKGPHTQCAA